MYLESILSLIYNNNRRWLTIIKNVFFFLILILFCCRFTNISLYVYYKFFPRINLFECLFTNCWKLSKIKTNFRENNFLPLTCYRYIWILKTTILLKTSNVIFIWFLNRFFSFKNQKIMQFCCFIVKYWDYQYQYLIRIWKK